jgi:UDP-N-acetylglucosamine--N-acetylmuramyl-(pentapeptide) pyrophosphoryl-undecaprenol N-acetylglucosamine transferase
MTKKNILIATGGTGGHIFPAIGLANNLLKKNFNIKLTTDARGLKFLKDHKNFKLIKISSSPLIKTTFIKLLISIIVIIFSILQSFLFLLLNRPSIIFGMGGYSSFPICIAASILRIKFVIYENNLIIGKANKYLLPFTKKVFVSYKELEGIPKKYNYKIVEVGNILREEILKLKLNDQKKILDSVKILVLGGSQGAKVFAEKLPYIFEQLNNNEIPIRVYQQCQKKQNDQLSEFYKKAKIDYEIFNFTNRITNYYSKVNLVITRSGASVLGELINFNIPFITIPLPTSADNHQYKNAEFYSKKGYGYLIEEKDIKNKLYNLVKLFFNNKSLKDNIVFKQKQRSDKDFFDKLYIQLERLLDEKN